MEISSSTAHHQKLMNAGASSTQTEDVVSCNSKPRQQSPAVTETQATVERKPRPHPGKEIDCPRCYSTDTKFCYYNNYSMSQPRYFCKKCRRYWTQGGSLRNVPIGGGCRKNRRSSTSSSSSASASLPSAAAAAASQINKLVPEPMVPLSCSDFPNVLPTFISTGFELPRDHLSLPFGSLSSNPAVTLAPGGTFLDMLSGGLLDGNNQSNDLYGPTSGGRGNGMVMPPLAFGAGAGLNLMMQQHGLGGTADHTIVGATSTHGVVNGSMDAGEEGDGGVKTIMGLQWQSQLGGGGGGVGSVGGQLQVGAQQQQQQQQQVTVLGNNVMMDDNDNNNGSSRDCYWNNAAPSGANPWQGLINSSSLI